MELLLGTYFTSLSSANAEEKITYDKLEFVESFVFEGNVLVLITCLVILFKVIGANSSNEKLVDFANRYLDSLTV